MEEVETLNCPRVLLGTHQCLGVWHQWPMTDTDVSTTWSRTSEFIVLHYALYCLLLEILKFDWLRQLIHAVTCSNIMLHMTFCPYIGFLIPLHMIYLWHHTAANDNKMHGFMLILGLINRYTGKIISRINSLGHKSF